MADEKKRYWLKLEKDFLDSKYIKIIKGVPNGTDYILFYLALMLASVDTVGHLRFTELVAYNEQMLASLTGTNIDIVRSAMKLFQELGMIRILEDGTIFMPEVPRLTGKESESAERVRLFREREKQEALQCNSDVTKCNDNKEKEKEEEKQRTENREQQEEQLPYAEIIAYLNSQSGSRYRNTDSTRRLIHARFNEGFTKEDFFKVIDNKVRSWKGTEWEKFLRPETLFCASKFQGYLNEKPVEKKHAGSKEGYSVDLSKYETI
jgi:predicted phage replisome organizer/uncharacterized phage protein (TIGR02220 family)